MIHSCVTVNVTLHLLVSEQKKHQIKRTITYTYTCALIQLFHTKISSHIYTNTYTHTHTLTEDYINKCINPLVNLMYLNDLLTQIKAGAFLARVVPHNFLIIGRI